MRDLVDVANSAGLRTSKQELLAALVSAAPTSADDLEDALRRYRRSTAGDIVFGAGDDSVVISIERRRPGRRTG